MKIRKLAAAAAVAGTAVLLAPSAAIAGANSASVTLPPGNRVCVDVPAPASFNARADGSSNRGIKYTFLVKPAGSTVFSPISETGDGATAWAAEANRYWQPYLFPGTFRACARNNGTLSANVNLSLRTDY
jgi:hypothetical protein